MTGVAVVGAGIVGMAVARRIAQVRPGVPVTVLDKEAEVAQHQTGRNSGVVHAGLYYAPGSLKARLCRRGAAMLREFCAEHDLPYQECGKLVVAAGGHELPRLHDLHRRAQANGVPGITVVGPAGIAELEPHVSGVAALHSPATAITDYAAVTATMAAELLAGGGQVLLGHRVVGLHAWAGGVTVTVQRGAGAGDGADAAGPGGRARLRFSQVVVCGGLQADRLARAAGDRRDPAIVPFRGEYLRLVPQRRHLVRALVYPVPDPAYPFLGVHLTRRVDGEVDLGPNAVLALAREGYRLRDVCRGDVLDAVTWPGSLRLARRHWRAGVEELAGSLSRERFVARAQRYLPALEAADVVPAPAGVRAQAVTRDGALLDDFLIRRHGPVTVVRNAPSPAATASLAIAEHVVATLPAP